jgi:transposase
VRNCAASRLAVSASRNATVRRRAGYRKEDIFARHGVIIRRSTLCDWFAAAADVALALYLRMGELVRQSTVVHADDTTVPLLQFASHPRPPSQHVSQIMWNWEH